MNNFAHLKRESPFYDIFENGMVPIINCLVPGHAIVEDGSGQSQETYDVDLSKLTPEQFEAVARICHSRFPDTDFEACKQEIRERGLPLRASQCNGVSTDHMFWL